MMQYMTKSKRAGLLVNFIAVMAVFVLLMLIKETHLINKYVEGILVQCCYFIIMATSLNVVLGFLGQLALGHAGFMAIGAYTSALVAKALRNAGLFTGKELASTLPLLLIGIICGACMAALAGMLVGIPALRLRGDYLAIITLGFGEIIRVIIQNLPFAGGKGLSAGKAGQPLIGIPNLNNLYVAYFITVLGVSMMIMFVNSRHGRAVKAIREDDIASEAAGINNTYYKVLAFTISAFFAGVAGAVFAHRGLGTIQAADFTFLKSTEYVIMVVLGGMGSLTGSVIASIMLAILPEALRAFADYRMLIYSVVLILMMIFRPTGLCGSYEFSLRKAILALLGRLKSGPGKKPGKKSTEVTDHA